MASYCVLAQAVKNEALTTYTDNVRLLEGLQEDGFMSKTEAETLKAAYCTYRDYGHKQVLNEAEVVEMSKQVENIWHEFME